MRNVDQDGVVVRQLSVGRQGADTTGWATGCRLGCFVALDVWIEAACRQPEACLATRNAEDFTNAGTQVINPQDSR